MLKKQWMGLALGLCAATSLAASAGEPAQARVYTFQVELDAGGALLSATPTRDAADSTTRQLQQELAQWVFRPAQQAGRPVPTSTWVRVSAIPAGDGAAAKILSATAGPTPEVLRKPEFPKTAQLRGQQGVVVLQLQMDDAGKVQDVEVHDTVGEVSRAMANAAIAAARDWTFRPERVDGTPIAGRLLMPVCFVNASDGEACAWTGPEAQAFDRDTVLALDPAVRLETAYAGR